MVLRSFFRCVQDCLRNWFVQPPCCSWVWSYFLSNDPRNLCPSGSVVQACEFFHVGSVHGMVDWQPSSIHWPKSNDPSWGEGRCAGCGRFSWYHLKNEKNKNYQNTQNWSLMSRTTIFICSTRDDTLICRGQAEGMVKVKFTVNMQRTKKFNFQFVSWMDTIMLLAKAKRRMHF